MHYWNAAHYSGVKSIMRSCKRIAYKKVFTMITKMATTTVAFARIYSTIQIRTTTLAKLTEDPFNI